MTNRFLQMLPGQKLILVRVETKQPPPTPIVAKRAPLKPARDPLWLTIILWLCVRLKPVISALSARAIRVDLGAMVVIAPLLVSTILEVLAADHIRDCINLGALC